MGSFCWGDPVVSIRPYCNLRIRELWVSLESIFERKKGPGELTKDLQVFSNR